MGKQTLVERVYFEMRQRIRNGNYSDTDCIVEKEICKDFDVSKATAGEVLHRLTQEGVLKSFPRKGYMLNTYDEEDFIKLQQLRFAVESHGIHKLIVNGDDAEIEELLAQTKELDNIEFHLALAKLVHDSFVYETLENLLGRAANAYSYIAFQEGVEEQIVKSHCAILEAVLNRDEEKAITALRIDLHVDDEEDPIAGVGSWKGRKRFTTDDMAKIAYLSEPQLNKTMSHAAVVKTVASVDDGVFYPHIALLDLQENEEIELPIEGNAKNPRFSPNGDFLAYLCDKTGEYQIYILDKSGNEKQLTTLRHGVNRFSISNSGKQFVFEAALWSEEREFTFVEMTPEGKERWLEERKWAPQEITEIDYKLDEVKGVYDGSITHIGIVTVEGAQSLLTQGIPYKNPTFSQDDSKIAFYGQPHKGPKYTNHELFYLNLPSGAPIAVTENVGVNEQCPPCFTQDSSALIYSAYYCDEEGNAIEYLYKAKLSNGISECLFNKEKEETSSGVYGIPGCRTQYGGEVNYYQLLGNEIYFVCAWHGAQRLYKMPIDGGVPEVVLEGEYSIHEFCLPNHGQVLITRGDYTTIRELYMAELSTGNCQRLRNSNPWLDDYALGKITSSEIATTDGKGHFRTWVCRPTNFNPKKKYPAVLYIHGGPTVSYTVDFWHEIQILAGAGYVVVYCDPRGSFGYGLKHSNSGDSWGTPAYEDLMLALDVAISQGFVDENNLGITGGSYGGYMTCKIIMETNRFKAAVAQRTFVNKATSYGTGDKGFYSLAQSYDTVNVEKCLVERARTSIIRNMDKIETPVLLLHGYLDYRCSFEQSEQLFIAMKERKPEIPCRLVMYPNENHGVSRTGLLHFQQSHVVEMVNWFNQFLKKGEQQNAQTK